VELNMTKDTYIHLYTLNINYKGLKKRLDDSLDTMLYISMNQVMVGP